MKTTFSEKNPARSRAFPVGGVARRRVERLCNRPAPVPHQSRTLGRGPPRSIPGPIPQGTERAFYNPETLFPLPPEDLPNIASSAMRALFDLSALKRSSSGSAKTNQEQTL